MPCGRVRTVAEALADPQIEPRQMLLDLDDPELAGFRVLGNPIKLSDHPHGAGAASAASWRAHRGILQELETKTPG